MAEVSPVLNSAQAAAVEQRGGHLLIVAGPGTGKTHTLIHRVAHQLPSLKSGQSILAITFTNKAARQMCERLASLVGSSYACFIGTFHAFCLNLLRIYWDRTALPQHFKVASPEDLKDFKKNVLERISFSKSTQLALESSEELKSYTKYLRQNNLIDFDDILRETLQLLEDPEVAVQVRQTYPLIFVDEYQDINVIQNALLKALVGDNGQLTAIGDPHQSIYGFRGCEVRLFHRFAQDFPGATTLQLRDHYRSCANLLAASSQVISRLGERDLELMANMMGEGKLLIHQTATDRAEADYVAARIEKLVGGLDMHSARPTGRGFGDIAILYRLNAQRHLLMQSLEHLGIPFQVSVKPPRPTEYSDEAVLGQFEETLDYSVEKVSLMTLHAAKGLEFPVVFMVGCEENVLPLHLEGMVGVEEEERRLFYVGMTRAKECLYLTYSERRQLFGKTLFLQPSPYLSDIQEELKAYEAVRLRRKIKKPEPVPDGQMKLF